MDLDLETYFNTAHLTFQQQVGKRDQLLERTIRVGERTAVRLHFANERFLSYFLPAIEHILIDNSEQEDLRICVWDSTDGSGKPPCPSWQTHRNYQWVDLLASEHVKVACELSPARMTAIDFQKKLALFWINDATQFPWFEQSRP